MLSGRTAPCDANPREQEPKVQGKGETNNSSISMASYLVPRSTPCVAVGPLSVGEERRFGSAITPRGGFDDPARCLMGRKRLPDFFGMARIKFGTLSRGRYRMYRVLRCILRRCPVTLSLDNQRKGTGSLHAAHPQLECCRTGQYYTYLVLYSSPFPSCVGRGQISRKCCPTPVRPQTRRGSLAAVGSRFRSPDE